MEGGPGQATDICAPASGGCAGGGGTSTRSEQNSQSDAHGALRSRIAGTNNPTGIFTFNFRTIWHDDLNVPATEVQYATSDAGFVDAYQKRSFGPTHFVSEQFYNNGTRGMMKRQLSEEEVSDPTRRIFRAFIDFMVQRIKLNIRSLNSNTTGYAPVTLNGNMTLHAPVAQHFDTLSAPPPLPIMEIARMFIKEQYLAHTSSDTNQTLASVKRARAIPLYARSSLHTHFSIDSASSLYTRQSIGQCGPGIPCPDGSCCNMNGGCGGFSFPMYHAPSRNQVLESADDTREHNTAEPCPMT